MNGSVRLAHYDAEATAAQRDDLIALYENVWLTGWKDGEPFFSRERFIDRLDKHLAAPGFELVTACQDGRLIGYMYGFSRTRENKFAACELMVAGAHRRQGIARRLHDELLSARSEHTAELLVEKGNTPAQAAYHNWGWHKTEDNRPFTDAPHYDVMVIGLPLSTQHR